MGGRGTSSWVIFDVGLRCIGGGLRRVAGAVDGWIGLKVPAGIGSM